jgi:hypothetical protein
VDGVGVAITPASPLGVGGIGVGGRGTPARILIPWTATGVMWAALFIFVERSRERG